MQIARAVPILTVTDLRSAVTFYTQLLEVDVLMDHGWIVTLGNAGAAPQFSLLEHDPSAVVNPTVSLEVDDVDRAYKMAVDSGVEIVHPLSNEPWGVRRFFLRDDAGNIVNVLSHRR